MTSLGKSVILEDNASCVALALDDENKHRPCTHHISIKWHHFKDQFREGWLTVQKVASAANWSDIFTKCLPKPQFEKLRNKMMGWNSSTVKFSPHLPLEKKVEKDNKIVDTDNPFERTLHVSAALASAEDLSHPAKKRKYDNKGKDNTKKKLSNIRRWCNNIHR